MPTAASMHTRPCVSSACVVEDRRRCVQRSGGVWRKNEDGERGKEGGEGRREGGRWREEESEGEREAVKGREGKRREEKEEVEARDDESALQWWW